jgi:hypothetical protein
VLGLSDSMPDGVSRDSLLEQATRDISHTVTGPGYLSPIFDYFHTLDSSDSDRVT